MNSSSKTQSIRHLMADHEAIRHLLGAYERFLAQIESRCDGGTAPAEVFDPHELWDVLDYLGDQLLMCHEEKEETALLPQLSRQGLSWNDANLQHTRKEHRHIRYLTRSLRQSVSQVRVWSRDDCRHFLAISRELSALLRRHMNAEEKHFFVQLDESLRQEDDERMAKQFESTAADFDEMPDAQKLQTSAEAFIRRYGEG